MYLLLGFVAWPTSFHFIHNIHYVGTLFACKVSRNYTPLKNLIGMVNKLGILTLLRNLNWNIHKLF